MKSKSLLLMVTCYIVCTQFNQVSAQISFTNPSLNGTPGSAGAAPTGWVVCASSPDVQPGVFCDALAPSNGNSYAGFCTGEYIGQQLPITLMKNVSYSFTAKLAHSPDYASVSVAGSCPDNGSRGGAGQLQFWGGTGSCVQSELLWTSPALTNTAWATFSITFTPGAGNYDYIMLMCPTPNANVLIDNLSPTITVLPVQYLYFSGSSTNEGTKLKWATASEKNSNRYIIERSKDGIFYEYVSELPAAGNSNTTHKYTYTDNNLKTTYYYRLKQLDFDNHETFSNLVAVSPLSHSFGIDKIQVTESNANSIKVNIAGGSDIGRDNYSVKIYNIIGKLLLSKTINQINDDNSFIVELPESRDNNLLILNLSNEQTGFNATSKLPLRN